MNRSSRADHGCVVLDLVSETFVEELVSRAATRVPKRELRCREETEDRIDAGGKSLCLEC